MPEGRYLSERAWLYVPFFLAVLLVSAIILVLPYDTVYVRDRTYLYAFLVIVVICVAIFLLGTLFNILFWMRGKGLVTSPERRLLGLVWKALRLVLSRMFTKALAVFFRDALYLSKLKGRSASRWFMHLMILGGFLLMFAFDLLVTLSMDILEYGPMIDEGGWAKLWVRDFGFVRTELPDAASILFLLAVVLGGFILEGMGIAGGIPGHTQDIEYSFLGYAISLVLPASSGDWYDAAWLIHGIMSALLIAYIPFSKLFHMIATPIAIELEGMMSKEVRR